MENPYDLPDMIKEAAYYVYINLMVMVQSADSLRVGFEKAWADLVKSS